MKKILAPFHRSLTALTLTTCGSILITLSTFTLLPLPANAEEADDGPLANYGIKVNAKWAEENFATSSSSSSSSMSLTQAGYNDLMAKGAAMDACQKAYNDAKDSCSDSAYVALHSGEGVLDDLVKKAEEAKENKEVEMNDTYGTARSEFVNGAKQAKAWKERCYPLQVVCRQKCQEFKDTWAYGRDYHEQCQTEFKGNAKKAQQVETQLMKAAGQSLIGKMLSGGGKMAGENVGTIIQGAMALGQKLFGQDAEEPEVETPQVDVAKDKKTCRQNPESPKCRCLMMGYNAPGCNPFEGRELDKTAVGRNEDPDIDKMLRDVQVPNEFPELAEAKVQGPSGRLEPGGGLDKGTGIGKGGDLDDGKSRGGYSNLPTEVDVKQSSTKGYTQSFGNQSQRRDDRYGLLGNKKKEDSLQLSKLMPHGERDPAAAYALEVSGSGGLSNFEKVRRKMKARCPYMKNDYCI